MKYFISISLFFLCIDMSAQSSIELPNMHNIHKNGKRNGSWIVNHNGTLIKRYIGEFDMGIPKGVFKHFYLNGQLKSMMTFKKLTGECYVENYSKEGNIVSQGRYLSKNLKDSIWEIFDNNGSILNIETYKKGVLQGLNQTYYSNGEVVESGQMVNGNKQGIWVRRSDDGKKIRSVTYNHGKLDGEWIMYDVDARVSMIGKYVKGYREGKWIVLKAGKAKKALIFKKGKEINTILY